VSASRRIDSIEPPAKRSSQPAVTGPCSLIDAGALAHLVPVLKGGEAEGSAECAGYAEIDGDRASVSTSARP
jgi:hypothetical protein